jgi:Asp-tRNA(Asn)/Glu-tRNA(Gln) amidotransferase B subunit
LDIFVAILGPTRDKVTEQCRKLHSEELHNLNSSSGVIREIKSRRMRWAGMWHACERREKCTRFWWESPKDRDYWED